MVTDRTTCNVLNARHDAIGSVRRVRVLDFGAGGI